MNQLISLVNEPRESDIGRGGLRSSAWCVVAAFGTYFCMYAFRKPFTAAGYQDLLLGGVGFKAVLVIAQVLGYTVSKFIGIKVVAEIHPRRRVGTLLSLIALAEIALILFGLTPAPYNLVWLFVNGLPLGMVFGLVLGFLEGRRQTEVLAAGLCGSFIVADGVTKSAGAALLAAGVSEYWMPALAGLFFTPPFLLFAWMLSRIPPPTAQDIAARSERRPMYQTERRDFFRRYALGLTLLVLVFLLVTTLRSLRADFAPEIWAGLRSRVPASMFALSEIVVALSVLSFTGTTVLVRDNRRAFFIGLTTAVVGALLIGLALIGLRLRGLTPFEFMVIVGIGLYLPYIAVHVTIFERLIAMTRNPGNIGYLMYLADSFGYLGYVGVLLARNFLDATENFLGFFLTASWTVAVSCLILLGPCWWFFATHPAARTAPRRWESKPEPSPVEPTS